MATLTNSTKNTVLLSNLDIANSFVTRAKGLIGKKQLDDSQGVWFPKCNWIHTFFMSIPIDVIYLDKKMKVKKLETHLRPGRLAAPVFKAHSVVEVSAGFIEKNSIEIGDILNVGH